MSTDSPVAVAEDEVGRAAEPLSRRGAPSRRVAAELSSKGVIGRAAEEEDAVEEKVDEVDAPTAKVGNRAERRT